jgi:hypothetical protein
MAVHIHPFEIPPRYYKPLGQIVAGWNLTEALVQSVIWHFHKIKNPGIGRLFTYRASAVEKLKMLKVTAERYVKDSAISNELLSLHREADRLRGRRNTFAHGLWGRMPNEHKTWKVFYQKDTDDTYLLKREVIRVSQLQDLAAEIRALNVKIKKFMRKIGAPPF